MAAVEEASLSDLEGEGQRDVLAVGDVDVEAVLAAAVFQAYCLYQSICLFVCLFMWRLCWPPPPSLIPGCN